MRSKPWLPVMIAAAVCILAGGCTLMPPKEPSLSPQEVVSKFYRWYIGYPGNPLVDKEYRHSPYLTESFIKAADEATASFDTGGGDPFLLAQDIPEEYVVGQATVSGDQANVVLEFYWRGNPNPTYRRVDLELVDGEWRISGVKPFEQ
ncbi:MAG: hypothetical protein GX620_04075 [Chloroflexi bacterium]|nr:hypothetical protein [Chloroflexota bacterium]